MDMKRILVADDEAEIRRLLRLYLEREGYAVDTASGGAEALDLFAARRHDLLILDLMMPGLDGFEVCRRVRAVSAVPVLMLSAKDAEADKVSGLTLGADDYVTKPFSRAELVARVKALLRRAEIGAKSAALIADDEVPVTLSLHGISVDLARHAAIKDGAPLVLPLKEFDLLVFFMRHPGRVFTRDALFRAVWGESAVDEENTVTVHIRRLRTKIERNPSEPELIRTVRGIGYSFAEGSGA
jgi:DNA-binding response OmpR family regulator